MTLADIMIQSVAWSSFELLDGPATEFGQRLSTFLSDSSERARPHLWDTMENHVFSADDIFTVAEPTIAVLLAGLTDDRPFSVRVGALDLMFHIVQAASFRNDDLGRRCIEKAGGGWVALGPGRRSLAALR